MSEVKKLKKNLAGDFAVTDRLAAQRGFTFSSPSQMSPDLVPIANGWGVWLPTWRAVTAGDGTASRGTGIEWVGDLQGLQHRWPLWVGLVHW